MPYAEKPGKRQKQLSVTSEPYHAERMTSSPFSSSFPKYCLAKNLQAFSSPAIAAFHILFRFSSSRSISFCRSSIRFIFLSLDFILFLYSCHSIFPAARSLDSQSFCLNRIVDRLLNNNASFVISNTAWVLNIYQIISDIIGGRNGLAFSTMFYLFSICIGGTPEILKIRKGREVGNYF